MGRGRSEEERMGRGFVKDTSELKKMKSNYIHV
jgi:hypothetical protein